MESSEIERAASLMFTSFYVTCLTGAGVSVESNIRPFRGPGGLRTEYGEPPMNGYQRFLADPEADWERRLSKEGHNGEMAAALEKASPNPAHYALSELQKLDVLRYLITQNVDKLHRAAGSSRVAEIHGNFRLLRCIDCGSPYSSEEISLSKLPPHCPRCGGIVKTDGVMFGEPIPEDALITCQAKSRKSDCLLLVGTSAIVYPAASFPQQIRARGGTLIEVDPYETGLTPICDIALRGKAGEILPQLIAAIKRQIPPGEP
jgi:NAD-dependent deacetylase